MFNLNLFQLITNFFETYKNHTLDFIEFQTHVQPRQEKQRWTKPEINNETIYKRKGDI